MWAYASYLIVKHLHVPYFTKTGNIILAMFFIFYTCAFYFNWLTALYIFNSLCILSAILNIVNIKYIKY